MQKSRLQTFEIVIFSYMCNETCLRGDSHTKLPAEEIRRQRYMKITFMYEFSGWNLSDHTEATYNRSIVCDCAMWVFVEII